MAEPVGREEQPKKGGLTGHIVPEAHRGESFIFSVFAALFKKSFFFNFKNLSIRLFLTVLGLCAAQACL